MAHGVKQSPNIWIHQALHGYSDGHQQLALSVRLKPRDQKTLLVLSDSSGPGAVLDEQGYITGYPLTQSGFFAISRTWPAREMPRPGCVWTHTLLIDFNDLATLDSLSSLLSLFMRPMGLHNYENYISPMCLVPATYSELSSSAKEWMKPVVGALYAKPKERIVATWPGSWVDDAVFAIWSQQWPRLRRNFRFCTLAASDRSTEGSIFDLQVLPSSKRNVRSRFVEAVDAEVVQPNIGSWLEDVLEDLMRPDKSGLRSFLRRIGPDVAGGREVFPTLCLLHQYLRSAVSNSDAVHEAIVLLQSEPLLQQAKSAKAVVAQVAMDNIDTLDSISFDFLWENLHLVDHDALYSLSPQLGQIVWQRDPQRLVPLQSGSSSERLVLDRSLDTLERDSLISGLKAVPQLLEIVLIRRPDLASEPGFWSNIEHDEAVFGAVAKAELQSVAIPALLKSGRSDSAGIAVKFFGGKAILEALSLASDNELPSLNSWVRTATNDVNTVARFIASRDGIPQKLLHSLALALHPDSLPNLHGMDPWVTAWRNSIRPINNPEKVFIFAYFLRRALGYSSESQAELFQLSFEPVHRAAAANNLSENSWRMCEPRLPSSLFWISWDRCRRIRAGVADMFVERSLPTTYFVRLTLDDSLFHQLTNYVAQSSKGRAYLKQVIQDLIDAGGSVFESHHQIIEEVLYGTQ